MGRTRSFALAAMPSKRLLLAFLLALAISQLLAAFIYHRVKVPLFASVAIGVLVPFLMAWAQQRKKNKQKSP